MTFLLWTHFLLDWTFSYQEDKTSSSFGSPVISLFKLLDSLGCHLWEQMKTQVVWLTWTLVNLDQLSVEKGFPKISSNHIIIKDVLLFCNAKSWKHSWQQFCSEFGGCGANGKFHAATMVEASWALVTYTVCPQPASHEIAYLCGQPGEPQLNGLSRRLSGFHH